MKKNVLFVCNGNVFRSSVAEKLFEKVLNKNKIKEVDVDSAGLVDHYEGVMLEKFLSKNTLKLALKYGVDLRRHKPKLVNKKMVKNATIIIVFSTYLKKKFLKKHPEAKNKVKILKRLVGYKHNINMNDLKGKSSQKHEKFIREIDKILRKKADRILVFE